MLTGIVLFAFAILLSLLLHEAGHMGAAKAFGIKVTRFFVGFGPTLWSLRRGETEYGVKLIPAGAFVAITGQVSLDDVGAADLDRAMVNKPWWQRIIVLLSGCFTHFVVAIAMFFAVFLIYPMPSGQSKVAEASRCLGAQSMNCDAGHTSPAFGKLRAGDRILSVDGHRIDHGVDQLSERVNAARGGPVTVVVDRDGRRISRTLTPKKTDSAYLLGIRTTPVLHRANLAEAVTGSITTFGATVAGTVRAIAAVPGSIGDMFTGSGDDENSRVVSIVGAGQIATEAYQHSGAHELLMIVATINISLGLINLLPLFPLDGCYLLLVLSERARGLLSRIMRRPDPGIVDIQKVAPVLMTTLLIVAIVAISSLVNDILHPLHLSS